MYLYHSKKGDQILTDFHFASFRFWRKFEKKKKKKKRKETTTTTTTTLSKRLFFNEILLKLGDHAYINNAETKIWIILFRCNFRGKLFFSEPLKCYFMSISAKTTRLISNFFH